MSKKKQKTNRKRKPSYPIQKKIQRFKTLYRIDAEDIDECIINNNVSLIYQSSKDWGLFFDKPPCDDVTYETFYNVLVHIYFYKDQWKEVLKKIKNSPFIDYSHETKGMYHIIYFNS